MKKTILLSLIAMSTYSAVAAFSPSAVAAFKNETLSCPLTIAHASETISAANARAKPMIIKIAGGSGEFEIKDATSQQIIAVEAATRENVEGIYALTLKHWPKTDSATKDGTFGSLLLMPAEGTTAKGVLSLHPYASFGNWPYAFYVTQKALAAIRTVGYTGNWRIVTFDEATAFDTAVKTALSQNKIAANDVTLFGINLSCAVR